VRRILALGVRTVGGRKIDGLVGLVISSLSRKEKEEELISLRRIVGGGKRKPGCLDEMVPSDPTGKGRKGSGVREEDVAVWGGSRAWGGEKKMADRVDRRGGGGGILGRPSAERRKVCFKGGMNRLQGRVTSSIILGQA